MKVRRIKRTDLRPLLDGPDLRHGHMLIVAWPRLTDKKVRNHETGVMEVVEPKGSFIRRRCILRSDWTVATPSGSFEPKGGIMFNVPTQAQAAQIRAVNDLYLALSLEGLTHPHGEPDHPVNFPLKHVREIVDTRQDVTFVVED